ncbi:MAG TPA: DUF1501 domain-containing protein, partial [Planctomycetaceae bacterium]|nr:DUF1501 domain-containing protein [Planctomycetaceae bacterium]
MQIDGGFSRRQLLQRSAVGFGYLALASMLAEEAAAEAPSRASDTWTAPMAPPGGAADPLAARRPHFPARAKRVIFLFMKGGPSHVDTFDYKPKL